jgi:hypothetical protein
MMFSVGMPKLASSDAFKRSRGSADTRVTIPAIALSDSSRGWIELSREELYERVWSEPAAALATEFGISDRGMGKVCARFEIPVPPRGYWQRLATGQRLKKTPLPRLKTKLPSKIQIRRSPTDTDAAIPDRPEAERQALSEKGSAAASS